MKITKSQLKQIIKEELDTEIEEGLGDVFDAFANPGERELERRRKIMAMSDEEFEEFKRAMADREQDAYERKAGFLQPDEEVPGESSERNRQHRKARQKSQYDKMSRSDQAVFDRAARKARRRRELGQDPLPGDEKYLALQEAALRKVLELIK